MTQSIVNTTNGSFQISQLPNGTIQVNGINEKQEGEIREISNFNYERSEIPQELIDQCEKNSIETGETYFIFDNEISNHIKSKYLDKKEDKRDFNLTQLLSTDKYHIGTELYFREMPSRFSYYDTETKLSNRYTRYNFVVSFFKKMRFEPSEFNLGPEYEQSFILEIKRITEEYSKVIHKFILRIKPNLFLTISSENFENDSLNINYFDGFFNPSKIIEFLKSNSPSEYRSIIRDITIEQIINT